MMSKFVVAVTGGIGSGKTAVSDRFSNLGIDVIDLDTASRVVVEPGTQTLDKIYSHFGNGVVGSDGYLDRKALRQQVFDNPTERRWLEKLLHPLINEWTVRQLQAVQSIYAMVVNPLLRARGGYVNRILVVDAAVEVQIERTMERDKVARTEAQAIVGSQLDRAGRLALADDIILNEGSLLRLDSKVQKLHGRYTEMAIA
ncbi:MAG: dephospho-CoA kinase [Gammaproteobacteria bacterium]|nr:dephospho-CoA kinase [Gammaproteobacteria bacterium]